MIAWNVCLWINSTKVPLTDEKFLVVFLNVKRNQSRMHALRFA